MNKLEDLRPNATVKGILQGCLVTVVNAQWYGSTAVELTYKTPDGKVANELLYRHDEPRIEVVERGRPWSFDGEGAYVRRYGLILQMGIKKKRKEEEFLTSAKAYLSTDFPNPQRTGCPPESQLKTLAERPQQAEQPARQHITCCSPCFKRYMELLAELKRRKAG